jgi:hypothetical protein
LFVVASFTEAKMAGKAQELGGLIRVADYLSMGLLARLVPPPLIDQALSEHGKHSQRVRDLPAHAVAYYVMALSLYQGVNTEEVLRVVTEGMTWLGANAIRRTVGKSAISAARTRLGADVMRSIAQQALSPLGTTEKTQHAFYRGLRLVSLDGACLEVADEAANRKAFGVPGTQQGRTGYPQLRFAGLLENGTHILFGVALGGYKDSEMSLAHQAVEHLKPGMLCFADRGLAGYPLWRAALASGAQLLWRVPKNRVLPVHTRLSDGSYLSVMKPGSVTCARNPGMGSEALPVRVIEYSMPGVEGAQPRYRLITTLLDPQCAPAQELAQLYQSRWAVETTFAEMKTTLKGADVVMRSKTPELVRQEFWGLLLAHHLVRKLMLEAALTRDREPDEFSFKHSLTLIRRKLPASGAFPPRAVPALVAMPA